LATAQQVPVTQNLTVSRQFQNTLQWSGILGLASQTLTDFSSGWTFALVTNPGSSTNQLVGLQEVGNTTFTGATGGNVSALSNNLNFIEAIGNVTSAPYSVYGSHDSGTTYVLIATGTITVSPT
jgi:hypothetical protein